MKIPSEDNQAEVSIDPRERGLDDSVRIAVALSGYGFAGGNSQIWLGERDLATFLEDLRQVEHARRGKATLRALSPDELDLIVAIVDRAGHVRVEVKVSRLVHQPSGRAQPTVALSFGFDPSRLPGLLRDFHGLAECGQSDPHTGREAGARDECDSSPSP